MSTTKQVQPDLAEIKALLDSQNKRITRLEKKNADLKSSNIILEDTVNQLCRDQPPATSKQQPQPEPFKDLLTLLELGDDSSSSNRVNPARIVSRFAKKNKLTLLKKRRLLLQAKRYNKLIKCLDKGPTSSKSRELESFISQSSTNRKQILTSLSNITTDNTATKAKGYRLRILESGMDIYTKRQALYKLEQLDNTDTSNGDYYKLKTWLDILLDIPWETYASIQHQATTPGQLLINSRTQMDTVVHGQTETKDMIIQTIGKMLANPAKCGNVFAIYGPPGVGKTTLIKEGMSRALNIPFSFISLGGATDSSYLDGHSYTYEGSIPGRIVDILRQVKCMNPIFYFDELDKVSETAKGAEIANLLIHLTDPGQNTLFQDKYLGNINLDISKSIFVFSFNDITKVHPVLLDRMNLIYVNGYNSAEKLVITRDYLLPELLETYKLIQEPTPGIKQPAVAFSNENLEYIINYDTGNKQNPAEPGVRQIKRRLEKICSQLNIIKLVSNNWTNSIHSILDKLPELQQQGLNMTSPLILSNATLETLLSANTAGTGSTSYLSGMYT